MTQDNDSTLTPHSGEAHVTSADGTGAVAKVISLDALQQALGKDFGGDPETALKSISDTFKYVGKRKEDIAKELAPTPNTDEINALKSRLDGFEADRFYKENPQYNEFRSILSKFGPNPAEAVKSPELAPLLEKVKMADDLSSSRSVVHSRPRIAQPSNKLQEAQEAANKGASRDDVSDMLARAITGN